MRLRVCLFAALAGFLLFPAPPSIGAPDDPNSACLRPKAPSRDQNYRTTGNDELDVFLKQERDVLRGLIGVKPFFMILNTGADPDVFAARSRNKKRMPGTVAFGMVLLRQRLWRLEGHGKAAVAAMLAHAHFHIYQWKMECELDGKARELHVDYLTGYYLGKRNYLEAAKLPEFAKAFFAQGHQEFRAPAAHGTLDERTAALAAGFQDREHSLEAAYKNGEMRFTEAKPRLPEVEEPKADGPEPAAPAPEGEEDKEGVGEGAGEGAGEGDAMPPEPEEPAKTTKKRRERRQVPCIHKIPCRHKEPCTHRKACTHRIKCQHRSACVHRVACWHKIQCVHQVACTHRVACQHRVACCHFLHRYDLEHEYDLDANGNRVQCQHRVQCCHTMHAYDTAHQFDWAHRFDQAHEHDFQHDWDFAHDYDYEHKYDLKHDWDPVHRYDRPHRHDFMHEHDWRWVFVDD